MGDIIVQLNDDILGGKSIQTKPDGQQCTCISGLRIKYHTLNSVSIKRSKICTSSSRTRLIKRADGIIPLHNIVHTALDHLNAMWCKGLKHPTNGSCLSPWDFHIFHPLQKKLNGCMFTSDNNLQGDVVMWLTNFPWNSLQFIWANLGTKDSAVQMPMLISFLTAANTFTCEQLWTAFQLYMSCIWQTHTLAHILCVPTCVHTHLFLLHDIMYMHSTLNAVPNNVPRLCSRISAIKALINTAWTESFVAAG